MGQDLLKPNQRTTLSTYRSSSQSMFSVVTGGGAVRDISPSMLSIYLQLKHMHSLISEKAVGFFLSLVAMKSMNKIRKNEKSFPNHSIVDG